METTLEQAFYKDNPLDQSGSHLVDAFYDAVFDMVETGAEFDSCLEWCSGIGVIGRALADGGLCSH